MCFSAGYKFPNQEVILGKGILTVWAYQELMHAYVRTLHTCGRKSRITCVGIHLIPFTIFLVSLLLLSFFLSPYIRLSLSLSLYTSLFLSIYFLSITFYFIVRYFALRFTNGSLRLDWVPGWSTFNWTIRPVIEV